MTDLGLARVSRLDQNPQLQIDSLTKAGVDTVVQLKASAVSDKWRTFRDQTLRQLQRGDTLTVWKLDRVGRSFIDLYDTVKGLHERGITFRSLTESIDLTSQTGGLVFMLLGWFAEFERGIIIERTKAGKAAMIEAGKHPGGPRTYGLAKDRTTVIEAEAAVLRDAATHALHKDPLAKITRLYNRLEIPTRRGGAWNVSTLRRMLLNDDLVPAILTEKQHADLVSLFADTVGRQAQGPPAQHLLSGILRCAKCQHAMYVVDLKQRDGTKQPTYRCYRRADGGTSRGCAMVSIKAATADEWVAEAVQGIVASQRFTDYLNARRRALLGDATTAEELADWQADIGELERILGTRYGNVAHRERRDELKRKVRQATAKLLAAPDLHELEDLQGTAERLASKWASWDVAERRRKLGLLLDTIVVKPVGKGARVEPGERLDPKWRF